MSSNAVIIVCDAHIGPDPADPSTKALHRFFREVPTMGNHLVINGDLFEFWFEYRSVIPRTTFPTLAVLAELAHKGVRVTMTGGNHDRWGGRFWREQLGVEFHRRSVELNLAGWRALVDHGDGDCEPEFAGRLIHRVIGNPLTSAVFRTLHPDFGFWLVKRLSGVLGQAPKGSPTAADAQAAHATKLLEKRPELDLVVLGHTHRPALNHVGDSRWYMNPGAWMNNFQYGMVTEQGPELCSWEE